MFYTVIPDNATLAPKSPRSLPRSVDTDLAIPDLCDACLPTIE
jgi:hypothetical protein